jgi:cell division protein FtsQ
VIGSSLGVAWGAHRYALMTPRFAIRDFQIQGARRLSHDQVLLLAGLKRGDNIFSVDVEQLERRLLENPWIATAKVRRRLPTELSIELLERQASALATLDGQLLLVSAAGELFKQRAPADPHDLPIFTGLSLDNLARDRERELARVGDLLEVLAEYERLPLAHAFPPQELHISAGGSVTVTVGKDGVALHLGKGPWREKLLMAKVVMGKAQRRGRVPRAVFLDNRAHAERVVVRMR